MSPQTLEKDLGNVAQSPELGERGVFSPEERFLLIAIRKGLCGERFQAGELPSVSESFDWAELLRLAFENRVASLLGYTLGSELKGALVPERESTILKKFLFETVQKNLRIKVCLNKILSRLRKREIEAVVLKGASLAFTIWPNMAMRQMHDIDLVVPFDRVREAAEVLLELGYEREGPYSIDWHLAYTKELSHFEDPESGLQVDLHFRFFTPNPVLRIEERPFLENAKPVNFGSESALALAPEELLVYLCIHVSVGHFLGDNMRSLLDIALLIQRYGNSLDAAKLKVYLDDKHVGPLMAFPLRICARHLGVDFRPVFEDAENALGLHFRGINRRVLETAADRFLLKIEPVGASEWALARLAREVIYHPDASVLDKLLCFVFPQDSVTDFRDRGRGWTKLRNTAVHRAKVTTRLIGSVVRRKEKFGEN